MFASIRERKPEESLRLSSSMLARPDSKLEDIARGCDARHSILKIEKTKTAGKRGWKSD